MQRQERCPICSSPDIRFRYTGTTTRSIDDKTWDVWQCNGCTHGFINPLPTSEELAPYYSATYEAYQPDHGTPRAVDGVVRHIKPLGKRTLDVGSGSGAFLRQVVSAGGIAEGVEPSPHPANIGVSIFRGTLDDYVSAGHDGPFDIITANHVIEHVPDPVRTLKLMKRLLAPGGMIWIAVPNAGYPIALALRARWHSTDLPYHLMQFTPRSMVKAGQMAGLCVGRQTTESLPAHVAASIRLYLRYRWLMPRSISNRITMIDQVAKRYAHQMDVATNGEAILTEFH